MYNRSKNTYVLIDFGFSNKINFSSENLMGTIEYVAPELMTFKD